ncbi:aldo/keto reductase [Vagococcus fluvialis]|uniref:Aldo/keto reductase n=1 Tax=Vagococcus fluvialis TaxID=2738 RepID=A0A7X6I3N7_9ENTE|nr:aldo/keto reductase [Vagococcus fluvialis]MDT2745940.1 aldo/keto reductase [Vagococcus fluvialis]NKC68019.1 aldo/keto reductase [Vagococcus fluvialis]UDM71150.1 aldo/keto reductase [Vagococcus fluvialis]UDM76009.1 aldo/keto reductase [Vagococcus fluvialis]UDM82837.1 aldo/keto reductase [Vagococcus fluvialis]
MSKTITLNNGVKMPFIGLGTWQVKDPEEGINAVKWAIEAGYKAIDTAVVYQNEAAVGEGIKQSGINREDLFVTTKVYNDMQGYDETHASFNESLERLQLDYVDLYLIHWPITEKYHETWRAMEEIYESGRAKAIGISNFHPQHIEDLMTTAKIKPMINQIELHPGLNQKDLVAYCKERDIAITAYSPLGHGSLLENPVIKEIGEAHNKSIAQVILRWDIQNGITVIPKSVNKNRIAANLDVFDFELSDDEMAKIDELHTGERVNKNPDIFVIEK